MYKYVLQKNKYNNNNVINKTHFVILDQYWMQKKNLN